MAHRQTLSHSARFVIHVVSFVVQDLLHIPLFVALDAAEVPTENALGLAFGISAFIATIAPMVVWQVGSGNAVHLNQFFCVPQARYMGVTPQDILDFELEDATHPLKDVDIKRAKDALKNDPFFQVHKEWQKAIEQMLKMGVRAEQQALAKWGLNFVIDEYLPEKLKAANKFLP